MTRNYAVMNELIGRCYIRTTNLIGRSYFVIVLCVSRNYNQNRITQDEKRLVYKS